MRRRRHHQTRSHRYLRLSVLKGWIQAQFALVRSGAASAGRDGSSAGIVRPIAGFENAESPPVLMESALEIREGETGIIGNQRTGLFRAQSPD